MDIQEALRPSSAAPGAAPDAADDADFFDRVDEARIYAEAVGSAGSHLSVVAETLERIEALAGITAELKGRIDALAGNIKALTSLRQDTANVADELANKTIVIATKTTNREMAFVSLANVVAKSVPDVHTVNDILNRIPIDLDFVEACSVLYDRYQFLTCLCDRYGVQVAGGKRPRHRHRHSRTASTATNATGDQATIASQPSHDSPGRVSPGGPGGPGADPASASVASASAAGSAAGTGAGSGMGGGLAGQRLRADSQLSVASTSTHTHATALEPGGPGSPHAPPPAAYRLLYEAHSVLAELTSCTRAKYYKYCIYFTRKLAESIPHDLTGINTAVSLTFKFDLSLKDCDFPEPPSASSLQYPSVRLFQIAEMLARIHVKNYAFMRNMIPSLGRFLTSIYTSIMSRYYVYIFRAYFDYLVASPELSCLHTFVEQDVSYLQFYALGHLARYLALFADGSERSSKEHRRLAKRMLREDIEAISEGAAFVKGRDFRVARPAPGRGLLAAPFARSAPAGLPGADRVTCLFADDLLLQSLNSETAQLFGAYMLEYDEFCRAAAARSVTIVDNNLGPAFLCSLYGGYVLMKNGASYVGPGNRLYAMLREGVGPGPGQDAVPGAGLGLGLDAGAGAGAGAGPAPARLFVYAEVDISRDLALITKYAKTYYNTFGDFAVRVDYALEKHGLGPYSLTGAFYDITFGLNRMIIIEFVQRAIRRGDFDTLFGQLTCLPTARRLPQVYVDSVMAQDAGVVNRLPFEVPILSLLALLFDTCNGEFSVLCQYTQSADEAFGLLKCNLQDVFDGVQRYILTALASSVFARQHLPSLALLVVVVDRLKRVASQVYCNIVLDLFLTKLQSKLLTTVKAIVDAHLLYVMASSSYRTCVPFSEAYINGCAEGSAGVLLPSASTLAVSNFLYCLAVVLDICGGPLGLPRGFREHNRASPRDAGGALVCQGFGEGSAIAEMGDAGAGADAGHDGIFRELEMSAAQIYKAFCAKIDMLADRLACADRTQLTLHRYFMKLNNFLVVERIFGSKLHAFAGDRFGGGCWILGEARKSHMLLADAVCEEALHLWCATLYVCAGGMHAGSAADCERMLRAVAKELAALHQFVQRAFDSNADGCLTYHADLREEVVAGLRTLCQGKLGFLRACVEAVSPDLAGTVPALPF